MLTAALANTILLIGAVLAAVAGVVLCEDNPPARDDGGAR